MDEKLSNFNSANNIDVPKEGWVYSIRSSIRMTLQQLGKRLQITPQSVRDIEKRESKGTQ